MRADYSTESEGKPLQSALELVVRQAGATVSQAALMGDGKAAYIDIDDYIN